METFATGVAGDLRVVLSRLSVRRATGLSESFFLGFFDESEVNGSAYAKHIPVQTELARLVCGARSPSSPEDHDLTLEAVILDPTVLGAIKGMDQGFPLLRNLTRQVDARAEKAGLLESTPTAPKSTDDTKKNLPRAL